ncbi:MAG: lipid A biosynthesis acyltransferase [Gammaproteobacteria bacterium]
MLRLACLLPYRWQMRLGQWLGSLAARLLPGRVAVARRNIELCFPQKSRDDVDALTRAHFRSLGMSLFETAIAWWRSDRFIMPLATIEGAEHVQRAVDAGRGAILLTAHFTSLEFSGPVLHRHLPPFDAVYRKHRSPLVNELWRRGRERSARRTIEKSDIKSMVRSLRDAVPVWYAPDQSYRRKQSELIPFMGEPAMTNTATSALAKLGNAVVLPLFSRRLPDDDGYRITIYPPLEDFPSDDAVADAARYNEIVGRWIREAPDEYWWVHRKFKGRPDSLPDAYEGLRQPD